MQNRDLPARQRLEAGLLLADLDVDPPGLDDFVPVPGAGFSIGRYPVTNKQFRRFMDDGGYDLDKPWWTEKAVAELNRLLGRRLGRRASLSGMTGASIAPASRWSASVGTRLSPTAPG